MAARIWAAAAFITLLGADKDLIPTSARGTVSTAPKKQPGKILTFEPTAPAFNGRPRLALVIGNGDYALTDDLPKVHTDTWLMVDALRGAGFRVVVVEDADLKTLKLALGQFAKTGAAMAGLEAAMVYYSGHGARIPDQEDMKNLLLPTDVKGEEPYILGAHSVEVTEIQAALLGTKAEVFISVLDACRNNPFHPLWVQANLIAGAKSVATKGGLDQPKAPPGQLSFLVAHAAQAGHVAWDGYYTPRLAESIGKCGEVHKVFTRTDGAVKRDTNGQQSPLLSSSMGDAEFHFHGGAECGVVQNNVVITEPILDGGRAQTIATCRTPRPSSEGKAGLHWVCVPGGDTKIGDAERGDGDEKQDLMVRFTQGFWMLETEVTGSQAKAFGLTGQKGTRPRTFVDWEAARKVCQTMGGDLPTEFQWEHAARGGGREGSWGAGIGGVTVTESNLGEYAWYDPNSESAQAVKTRTPNAFGLYDLWGNVWEWTLDGYDSNAYRKWTSGTTDNIGTFPLLVNPGFVATIDRSPPSVRVDRGGSFVSVSWFTRSGYRRRYTPSREYSLLGFRCVSGSSPLAVDL